MGRHSLPDSHAAEGRRGHPSTRRRHRTVAIATLLVLAVATGTAVAAKGGLLSFSESCEDSAVHLSVVASPDIARAARSLAEQARADEVKADGRRLAVEVLARDAHKVAEALAAGLQPVPGGATGLYDTTLASYKEARSTYVKGKFNALVILTDGSDQDTNGISRSGLITELKELVDPERPVPVIAIAVGPDADRDEVAEIARVTGGDGYEVSDPAEIQAVILQAIMAAGQNGRAAQE
ncbi:MULTISPECIES: hypothetical protein [unclassified Streptomyces]|uniref:hypothetical protein n=1 Tax=unclassified Streptomyces TaxID=2593676 RepID=UPI0024A8B451|nr:MULTISPECIES: hypothetical protein [unclassified Streptomyces]